MVVEVIEYVEVGSVDEVDDNVDSEGCEFESRQRQIFFYN